MLNITDNIFLRAANTKESMFEGQGCIIRKCIHKYLYKLRNVQFRALYETLI